MIRAEGLASAEMVDAGQSGSIVTLLCDGGERYSCTYYQNDWLAERGIDPVNVSELSNRISDRTE